MQAKRDIPCEGRSREGDSEIERFGLWVCFALGNRWCKLWVIDGLSVG